MLYARPPLPRRSSGDGRRRKAAPVLFPSLPWGGRRGGEGEEARAGSHSSSLYVTALAATVGAVTSLHFGMGVGLPPPRRPFGRASWWLRYIPAAFEAKIENFFFLAGCLRQAFGRTFRIFGAEAQPRVYICRSLEEPRRPRRRLFIDKDRFLLFLMARLLFGAERKEGEDTQREKEKEGGNQFRSSSSSLPLNLPPAARFRFMGLSPPPLFSSSTTLPPFFAGGWKWVGGGGEPATRAPLEPNGLG